MSQPFIPFDAFRINHRQSMDPTVLAHIEPGSLGSFGKGPSAAFFTKLEKSIYYKTLETQNFELYERFVRSVGQEEHSQEVYKNLIENFDLKKMEKIQVRKFVSHSALFVEGGNHRVAILKFFNKLPGVPHDLVEITYCDFSKDEIGNALKSTTGDSVVKGWNNSRAPYGYHSFTIANISFKGQRSPQARLDKIRNFLPLENKRVLDLGCNTGGMLLHAHEISRGYGIDLDPNCIAAATKIRSKLFLLGEYTFETRNADLFDVEEFCRTRYTPDVIFLLSLGSWLTNWSKIYADCYSKARHIVFETNNDREGSPQLLLFTRLGAEILMISDKSDDDSTGNLGRKMYLITNKSIP